MRRWEERNVILGQMMYQGVWRSSAWLWWWHTTYHILVYHSTAIGSWDLLYNTRASVPPLRHFDNSSLNSRFRGKQEVDDCGYGAPVIPISDRVFLILSCWLGPDSIDPFLWYKCRSPHQFWGMSVPHENRVHSHLSHSHVMEENHSRGA